MKMPPDAESVAPSQKEALTDEKSQLNGQWILV